MSIWMPVVFGLFMLVVAIISTTHMIKKVIATRREKRNKTLG